MEIITLSWRNRATAHHRSSYSSNSRWQKSLKETLVLFSSSIKALFAIYFSVICLFLQTSSIQATTSSEGLTVDPIFQEISIDTQEKVETTFFITNETSSPQEISISAKDIIQEQLTGKLIFLADDLLGYPHTLAPYIKFDKDRFIIPPGETEYVLATIQNRDSLGPGGHYSAVVVQAHSEENSQKTTILPGLASVLFVKKLTNTVIEYNLETLNAFNLIFFSPPTSTSVVFHNTGNSHIIPRGTIKLTGWQSRHIAQKIFNPDSAVIFPNTRRSLNSQIQLQNRLWPIEPLTIELFYRDETEESFQRIEYSGVYINPFFALGSASLMVIIIVIKKLRKK